MIIRAIGIYCTASSANTFVVVMEVVLALLLPFVFLPQRWAFIHRLHRFIRYNYHTESPRIQRLTLLGEARIQMASFLEFFNLPIRLLCLSRPRWGSYIQEHVVSRSRAFGVGWICFDSASLVPLLIWFDARERYLSSLFYLSQRGDPFCLGAFAPRSGPPHGTSSLEFERRCGSVIQPKVDSIFSASLALE